MGLELLVKVDPALRALDLMARLAKAGLAVSLAMIDGALVPASAAVPDGWRELRIRLDAGTVTLTRKPGGVAVTVFGNADEKLRQAQVAVASALGSSP